MTSCSVTVQLAVIYTFAWVVRAMLKKRGAGTISVLLGLTCGLSQLIPKAVCQQTEHQRWPVGVVSPVPRNAPFLGPQIPSTESTSYQKAITEFKAGKLNEAVVELRSLHSAAASNALGVVLEAKGESAASLAAFQAALELQPDFIEASYNAASLFLQEGRPSAAVHQMEATLGLHSSVNAHAFELRLLLAKSLAFVGDDEHARAILSSLAIESPNSAEVRLDLGMAYARLTSFQNAVEQFLQELRIRPSDPEGLIGVSKALLDLRSYSEAVPYLKGYVDARPQDAQGHYALGYALQASGSSKEAIVELSHAERLDPEDYNTHFFLGMALWRAGQLEAAAVQFEAAERLKPEELKVHFELTRVLGLLGRKQDAVQESDLSKQLGLRDSRIAEASSCIVLGNSLREEGKLEEAEAQFRQASALDARNAGASYNLGLVLSDLNNLQAAQDEFNRAVSLDPHFALAYNALGLSYKKEGKTSQAMAAIQKAIQIDPQFAEAKNSLGTLYATLGQSDKAAALFEEAAEDSPDYSTPYLNWGLLLANNGDLNGAKSMLEKALQRSPDSAEVRKDLQMVSDALK